MTEHADSYLDSSTIQDLVQHPNRWTIRQKIDAGELEELLDREHPLATPMSRWVQSSPLLDGKSRIDIAERLAFAYHPSYRHYSSSDSRLRSIYLGALDGMYRAMGQTVPEIGELTPERELRLMEYIASLTCVQHDSKRVLYRHIQDLSIPRAGDSSELASMRHRLPGMLVLTENARVEVRDQYVADRLVRIDRADLMFEVLESLTHLGDPGERVSSLDLSIRSEIIDELTSGRYSTNVLVPFSDSVVMASRLPHEDALCWTNRLLGILRQESIPAVWRIDMM